MLNSFHLLVLGALPFALAQYGSPPEDTSSSSSAATPSATSSAASSIHTVTVGKSGFVFSPDTITASVGEQVQFQFFPPNHTVTQSSFETPCQPLNSTSFFSGFMATSSSPGPQTFTITITDTNPIWFYCSQTVPADHCAIGMVGVINPPTSGSNTLDAYKKAAANVQSSGVQPSAQGGVIAALSTGTPSAASTAASSATGTAAAATSSKTGVAAKQYGSSSGIVGAFAGLFAMLLV